MFFHRVHVPTKMSQKAPSPTSPTIEITHLNSRVVISHRRQTERVPQGTGPNLPHISHFPCDAVQSQHAFLACVVVTQARPSDALFSSFFPIASMNSIMILGLSFVLSFSVLTPFLMLMRGLLGKCLIRWFQNNHLCQSGSLSKNGGHLEWDRSRGF